MRSVIVALTLLASTVALAQDYAAPSAALWNQMVQAIQGVSMPLTAHQQVNQIMQGVQQQALQEAAARKKDKPRE